MIRWSIVRSDADKDLILLYREYEIGDRRLIVDVRWSDRLRKALSLLIGALPHSARAVGTLKRASRKQESFEALNCAQLVRKLGKEEVCELSCRIIDGGEIVCGIELLGKHDEAVRVTISRYLSKGLQSVASCNLGVPESFASHDHFLSDYLKNSLTTPDEAREIQRLRIDD